MSVRFRSAADQASVHLFAPDSLFFLGPWIMMAVILCRDLPTFLGRPVDFRFLETWQDKKPKKTTEDNRQEEKARY